MRPAAWTEFVRADGTSLASGAIIKVAGITGRIRGLKYKRSDGRTVRPSLVVLDDPQTDESARSLRQCATREGDPGRRRFSVSRARQEDQRDHALHGDSPR
jgi:hypothetical protein